MATERYLHDLQEAQDRLAALEAQSEQIEKQIARLKRKIALLTELADDTDGPVPVPDLDLGGLTAACSTVLRASRKEWLTAGEVQSELKQLGFALDKYKAPAAVVTTTLNRLAESGKVQVDKRAYPATTEYKWVAGGTRLMNALEGVAEKWLDAREQASQAGGRETLPSKVTKRRVP